VTKPLEPGDAAEIVAEDVELTGWGADQANQTGIGTAQFDALVQAVLNSPGVAELLTLWRRGEITDADVSHGLRKNRLESRWDKGLKALKNAKLPPAVAALAAVRGLIDAEGTLPVAPPTETGKVPAFPVYPISGKDAAHAVGLTDDEYAVMVGINGRPMSLHEAASAYFRGIIEQADYYRAVSEGDTRNEWRDAILDQAREILTAHDWVELNLRGYISQEEMYAGTALHGMSQEDSDRLFRVLGRPLTVHQITTGLARGAKFNPIPGELTDPYEASVHESNIKPSYYELAIANRYNYPSLFQLNTLVKGNAITADQAADWANKDGYAPEVVTVLHDFWTKEQASAGGTGTTKPKTFTYSQIHQAWKTGQFTDAQALAELESIGYPAAKAQTLLSIWKASPPTSGVPA
jgi:hypothetical protein